MKDQMKKVRIKIRAAYHEFWRRYHNLRYSKHRRRASRHLAKRGRPIRDERGRTVYVRQEA